MKPYLLSLAAGLLVGIFYGIIHTRSPAPPVIALAGLLGILGGEQIPPLVRHLVDRPASMTAWISHQVKPHIFGRLPQGSQLSADDKTTNRTSP